MFGRAPSTAARLSLWLLLKCAVPWMKVTVLQVKVITQNFFGILTPNCFIQLNAKCFIWSKLCRNLCSSCSSTCWSVIDSYNVMCCSWGGGGRPSGSCLYSWEVQGGQDDRRRQLRRGERVRGEIHGPRVRTQNHQQGQMQRQGEIRTWHHWNAFRGVLELLWLWKWGPGSFTGSCSMCKLSGIFFFFILPPTMPSYLLLIHYYLLN